jgi:glycosyltransferase involved in cell wall biosynthesis
MKIFIHHRDNHNIWGGDMAAINSLAEGLKLNGVDVTLGSNIESSNGKDLVVLTNTCLDQRPFADYLLPRKIPYAVLPFHEDFIKYYQLSISFAAVAYKLLNGQELHGIKFDLNYWIKNPHIIAYNFFHIPVVNLGNARVLEGATSVIPSSGMERKTIMRDCPGANAHVVKMPPGLALGFSGVRDDSFLKLIDQEAGYILQVGRFETRKNQIASVLATFDIPRTLVFVASRSHHKNYSELLFDLIKKYRKHKTIVVSEEHESIKDGNLEIIQMPSGQKLSLSLLESAYRNAGVNLHPAFYELPGYTCLESISCGVKTIMSKWSSAEEYIRFENEDGCGYVDPCDIENIREMVVRALYGDFTKLDQKNLNLVTVEDYGRRALQVFLNSRVCQ